MKKQFSLVFYFFGGILYWLLIEIALKNNILSSIKSPTKVNFLGLIHPLSNLSYAVILGMGGGILLIVWLVNPVTINANEVGIVFKKIGRHLPRGQFIALEKEAGYQADILNPGRYWGYWSFMFIIYKASQIIIPQGEIGLVIAMYGNPIPEERNLGKPIDCNNFQDASAFLRNGGEKGRQSRVLSSGNHRINTEIFTIVTAANATQHGMKPEQLRLYAVPSGTIGIVTTLDGKPLEQNEIAGAIISGHNSFQNAQKFIEEGGGRGLQEEVIQSGIWILNPWFVQIEQVSITEISLGYVGVVNSSVGETMEASTDPVFSHANLVNYGSKGVWNSPLYPGKHAINTKVNHVEFVPTTNIALNWSDSNGEHKYDSSLNALEVRSKDGFGFKLEVTQIIHIAALNAPKVISRVGSMENLVKHVLQPTIDNYFRNSAQANTVLDFISARTDRQAEAANHIKSVLVKGYDVQAIDTLIGEIEPPKELMQTQIDRTLAEEKCRTYEQEALAEQKRQQMVRAKAEADIQTKLVECEQNLKMSELNAKAKIKETEGEAESLRLQGKAEAEVDSIKVNVLGSQEYVALQIIKIVSEHNLRVVPDVAVNGNGVNSELTSGLVGMFFKYLNTQDFQNKDLLLHNNLSNPLSTKIRNYDAKSEKEEIYLPQKPIDQNQDLPRENERNFIKNPDLQPVELTESIRETISFDLDSLPWSSSIDYTVLKSWLETSRWEAADLETWNIMCKTLDKPLKNHLNLEDLKKVPLQDLQIIDYLWAKYSNNKFGFKIKQQIYQEVRERYPLFGTKVGWLTAEKGWISVKDITYSSEAPAGHLPIVQEAWKPEHYENWSLVGWKEWLNYLVSVFDS